MAQTIDPTVTYKIHMLTSAGITHPKTDTLARAATIGHEGYNRAARENLASAAFAASKGPAEHDAALMFFNRAIAALKDA